VGSPRPPSYVAAGLYGFRLPGGSQTGPDCGMGLEAQCFSTVTSVKEGTFIPGIAKKQAFS
jgi:hypothetical protein